MVSFSAREMASPSSLFAAYASMSASIMLLRSMANELIPRPLRNHLFSTLRWFIKPKSPRLTLLIEDSTVCGMGSRNVVFDAAEVYLSTKVSPNTERLRIWKTPKGKNLTLRFCQGETIVDQFDGVELKWRYVCDEPGKQSGKHDDGDDGRFPPLQVQRQRLFELSFHKKHKEMVLASYVPMVLESAELMQHKERILKMHTLNSYKGAMWDSVNLEHPSTFDTLAMEPELKTSLIQDLDRFVSRKEFYKRVGKAWKRGYLLYGPPGTGKSSLVAAMANYLRFDVYDLQLGNIRRDSDLRRLLLATANRSILVIEDIDCSVDLPERKTVQNGEGCKEEPDQQGKAQLTLSGLLNFVDGLWSSCGDERIIIFTTNHKERLDPALLRPGRMDMHIHMSYCTPPGFRTLASNYLSVKHHRLFGEVEGLLGDAEVTPAEVAEEMMKSEDADVAMEGLVKLLKRKKLEGDEAAEDADAMKLAVQGSKRRKIQSEDRRSIRIARSKGWKKKLL